MNLIFKMVLSMSLSGAVLILVLLFGGRFLKGRLGRQWQYYVWLIVLLRLLIPFGPEESLLGSVYQDADRMLEQMTQAARQSTAQAAGQRQGQNPELSDRKRHEQNSGQGTEQRIVQNSSQFAAEQSEETTTALAGEYLWVIWLAVAFGMLIRKMIMYRGYIKSVTDGAERVSDVSLLDMLALITEREGVCKAVELCVNPLVSTPMLLGYFHPCIVLPDAAVSEKDFYYIAMHELTHYKRRDILYKWLVQFCVCLHWFNPLVCVMSREIDKACELACDEAVVAKIGYENAGDYGKTLLEAMAAAGIYREPFAAVSLSAGKELLKERLGAIMNCKKKTKRMRVITAGVTVCIVLGAVFIGVYPAAAAEPEKARALTVSEKEGVSERDSAKTAALSEKSEAVETDSDRETVLSGKAKASASENKQGAAVGDGALVQEAAGDAAGKNAEKNAAVWEKPEGVNETDWADAERYYKSRALPMFHIAFDEMDEKGQELWLDRFYMDREVSFFTVSVWALDADSPLISSFAEKFYKDGDTTFFSVLAKGMDEETLEGWLDRAATDQKWGFQSILYHELDRDEEWDEMEKAMAEEQRKAYQAVGVTWNGKKCYYEGQLVRIFLDIHMPNRSFYTLDMNPEGTVDIKIVRTQDGQITGVAYMSEAETEELLTEPPDASVKACYIRADLLGE